MRWLEARLQYLLILPAFFPLLYAEGLLYPYVAPKTFVYRALALVVAASMAYLALRGRSFYLARLARPITWIPGALLMVAYVTSYIGIDFYHSFWSTFDRGDGLLTLTATTLFFYSIILVADERFLTRLCKVAAWVGGFLALYVVLQWCESVTGMNVPLIQEPRGRFGGTFGNAAFLSSYLAMTIFLTFAAVREYRGAWVYAAYASIALQIVAVILAATRGALLALVASSLLAALFLAVRGTGRVRTVSRITLAALILALLLFVVFRAQLKESSLEPVRRIARISLADATVASRVFLFTNIGGEALKHPLTGIGGEHVEVVFNRVYSPEDIREEWFDRSHNAFLDYFVQFGIVGLVLYSALILGALYAGYALFAAGDTRGGYLMLLVLTYAIQNFVVFDTALSLWLLQAVFAAGLATVWSREPSMKVLRPLIARASGSRYRYLALGAGALILVLIYPVALQPLRANRALVQAYVEHVANVPRANEYIDNGLALGTYGDLEYGYQLYEMYSKDQSVMLTGESRRLAFEKARATLLSNFERYPYDGRTAVYLAHVLDLTPPEAAHDEALLNSVINRAIEISPQRLQPWYLRANISLKKGDAATTSAEKKRHYGDAIAVLVEYGQRQPRSADPRYIIANLYLAMGDTKNAASWAAEGERLYTGRVETAERAVKYYLNTENWEMAKRFLTDVVTENPAAFELQYDLAKVTFLSGDKEGAKRMFEFLRSASPGLVETDPAFMQAIQAE